MLEEIEKNGNLFYRKFTNGYWESFKTQKSFSSAKEAITHIIEDIVENLCCSSFNESNLYIQYYSYDKRIESDTFLISIGCIGKEDYIKKYGYPQAYGWLYFKSEWKDKILEWKKIHEDKYIQAECFVEFFDGTPKIKQCFC